MRALRLALLFLFVFAAPAFAQYTPIHDFKLANGLQVVVIENHRMPIISHMVWYRVGAIDEVNGKTGLAHFMEHLMFKGTKTVPAGEFSKRIAEVGGTENAFTSYDFTAYFQQLSRENLETAMRLEADRMQNLSLKSDDIEKERLVILEERRSRVDNDPGAQLMEEVSPVLYGASPYGRPLIGYADKIAKLSQDDIMDFYKAHYAPNNAILILSGDISLDDAQRLAEKYYGALPAFDIPARKPQTLSPAAPSRTVTKQSKLVSQKSYYRMHKMPSYGLLPEGDLLPYALQIWSEYLGGGGASLLYQEFAVRRKIATSFGVSYDPGRVGETSFSFYATLADTVGEKEFVRRFNASIDAALSKPIPPERLSKIKRQLAQEYIYAQDSNFHQAYVYGQSLAQGRSVTDIQSWPARIAAVTDKDLEKAATLIKRTRPVAAWLKPAPGGRNN